MNWIDSRDKEIILKKQKQISQDIRSVRLRLEQISEREYGIKQEFKKQSQNYVLAEEEINEMKEFKQKLLAQVESLLYLDQHMSFDPGRLINYITQ